MLLLILVLLILFGGTYCYYPRTGSVAPTWGGPSLWTIVLVVLIYMLVSGHSLHL